MNLSSLIISDSKDKSSWSSRLDLPSSSSPHFITAVSTQLPTDNSIPSPVCTPKFDTTITLQGEVMLSSWTLTTPLFKHLTFLGWWRSKSPSWWHKSSHTWRHDPPFIGEVVYTTAVLSGVPAVQPDLLKDFQSKDQTPLTMTHSPLTSRLPLASTNLRYPCRNLLLLHVNTVLSWLGKRFATHFEISPEGESVKLLLI